MKQYATLGDTIYFWFAGNDTSGSGGDGATPLADVRLAGAAAGVAPVFSPTPILLTDAGYPAGCHELAVAATAGNGCAANNTYAVFCTLAIDSQNPTGFIGSFDLKPVLANAKQLGGTNQTGRDIGASVLLSSGSGAGQLDFTSGVVKSNLAQILGTALTETAGYLAAGFKKLFNVATPVLTAESVNQAADNNVILAHADYGNAKLVRSTTPANKLDVSSTGEAGLDFANIKNATGAHTLTNITVPTCTTNSDMRGTDGANTTVPDAAGTAATPAEVATALSNINLDHLCKTATAGADMTAEVVDNSILSRILANGDTSAFDPTSDGLQLIRDRGDAAWTTGAGGSDRLLMVDTTIATLASQTSFTLTAGSTDNNAYRNCTIVIEDASTATQKAIGVISAYTGATKTITLKYDPAVFTMATTDKVYILAENALKSTLANRQLNVAADGDIAGNIDGTISELGTQAKLDVNAECDTALSDYGANITTPPTVTQIRTEMDTNSTKMAPSQVLADYKATGFNTTVPDAAGTAETLHGITDGKIDTNKTELDGLQGTDGKALISTDAQDLSGNFDVNTKTATATALDLILKDSTFALAMADAIWDEILTGTTHNIATSAGRRVREIGAFAIESGTAQGGTLTSITLAATANGSDGIFNRNLIVLTGNTGKGQTRTIVDYNSITKVVVIDRDWRVIPDDTTEYQVTPDDTPLTVDHGIVQGATATTITIRDYASSVNNAYLCNIVAIMAGKGRGQTKLVGSYNGTTKVITICGDDWVEIPDTTSVYVMMPYGTTCVACLSSSALELINAELDNVLNTAIPGSVTADSINQRVKAIDDLIQAGGDGDLAAIKAKADNLPSGIAKNVALPSLDVFMVLTSDHVSAATGKTVICQIRKDGGAFANSTNAVTEVGSGWYTIADGLTQAEMNADKIVLKFTASDCDQKGIEIFSS